MPDVPESSLTTQDDSSQAEAPAATVSPQRGRRWGCLAVAVLTIGCLFWAFGAAIKEARIAARHSTNRGNLFYLGFALHQYHDQHGCLPPAYIADENGRPMHSWRVLLLPFLDRSELYEQYDFSQPWDSPHNRRLESRIPFLFRSHRDDQSLHTNYLAVVGPDTAWPGAASRKFSEITDDFSSTILLVESQRDDIHWMEPRDLSYNDLPFEIGRPEGISARDWEPSAVTADGGLRKLETNLPPHVVRTLLTATSGATVKERDGRWVIKKKTD